MKTVIVPKIFSDKTFQADLSDYPSNKWELVSATLNEDNETYTVELNNISGIPQIITRRQFKIALAVLGKNETDILNGINQLPEPTQTIARISYTEAGTFERFNPELIFVATNFLQMTESDIDEIFTIGNQY
jgi:nitrate/nitrite-specific signal transduction histidine kinase